MKRKSEPSKLATLKQLVPCAVCGMSSSGRHYGAFSCEGCRNFFKRSLVGHQYYSCRHAADTVSSNCKQCRFTACLRAGMSMTAVRVGRPTADEREAVSAYLTKLESEQKLLRQPILRKRPRRVNKEFAGSTSSFDTSNAPGGQSSPDEEVTSHHHHHHHEINNARHNNNNNNSNNEQSSNLSDEFQRRFQEAAAVFNAVEVASPSDGFIFSWPMTPGQMWEEITSRMEEKIVSAMFFMRAIPGFPKIGVNDRVILFSAAALPIVAARCFHGVYKRNPNITSYQLAFETLCSFLSINGACWQTAKTVLQLQRLEEVFQHCSQMIIDLAPSESEFSSIYVNLLFRCRDTLNVILEDSTRVETISRVYISIFDEIVSKRIGVDNANGANFEYIQARTHSMKLVGSILQQTTQIIANVQRQCANQDIWNTTQNGQCFYFNEIMRVNLNHGGGGGGGILGLGGAVETISGGRTTGSGAVISGGYNLYGTESEVEKLEILNATIMNQANLVNNNEWMYSVPNLQHL